VKTTRDYLMGIDLGTSSTKTVIIDKKKEVVATAAQEYGIDRPQPEQAEQNPQIWVQAAWETMRTAVNQAGLNGRQISGIGIAGQMHGTVCLDSSGTPIRPAIIWADQRSQSQVMEVYKKIGHRQLGEWTGNPLATGFMLATWLWLLGNEPGTMERASKLLLPKDYLRYRLTGKSGSEPSDASSTLLFNTAQQTWCHQLLDTLNLNPEVLPEIHSSSDVSGGLIEEAAAITGLQSGIPVIYGGSDQAMQALGHGIIEPGPISCTIGSGGQLFAPVASPTYDPELRLHLFCHVLPEMWHLEAAILSAGLSLKWLRDKLFLTDTYQSLADAASFVKPGAEGLFFLPHLTGERTPYMDPQAKGAFVGLTIRHGRGHLVRAVMEGVVMALKSGLDIMTGLGAPVERIVASGGATYHPLWQQLQADIFNLPVYRSTQIETAALGAAILAGIGTGVIENVNQLGEEMARSTKLVVNPSPENIQLYDKSFQIFSQLYPALKIY